MVDHSHPAGHMHAHAAGETPHSHENTHPPASAEKETPPVNRAWVIGIILIVILAIVGVLIYTKLNPAMDTPPDTIQPVQVKLVVDEECQYCPQTSTILAKLDESNVKYEITKYDVDSEGGKALIEEFDITYAPTVLLSVQGLDQNARSS